MDGELARRIDLARIDARRRHHDSVLPEHLLAVVIETHEVQKALRNRGLDFVELRERMEGRLASRPVVGGYRDGSEAPLSAPLERVIARHDARSRSWLRFIKKRTVLDPLLLDPSIAALVFDLRRANDYRYVIERSLALAVMSGHAEIGVEHLFRTLLDLRSFVDAIESAGGDVEGFRTFVAAALTKAPAAKEPLAAIAVGHSVERTVFEARVMAKSSGATSPSIRQLCLALALRDDAIAYWCAAGMEASDFVHAVHLPEIQSIRARSLFR